MSLRDLDRCLVVETSKSYVKTNKHSINPFKSCFIMQLYNAIYNLNTSLYKMPYVKIKKNTFYVIVFVTSIYYEKKLSSS